MRGLLVVFALAGAGEGQSVHRGQMAEVAQVAAEVGEDALAGGEVVFPGLVGEQRPAIEEGRVVFGYLQLENQVFHTRWHALTHVGSRFVTFDASGNLSGTSAFTGRSSYLTAGGAAEAAGVKVILVVNQFDDAPGGVIETVMTSPARRAVLVGQIVALLAADSYSHGVSMDLEFSWGPAVRDGITAFMGELRAALDGVNEAWELSIYTNAIFSASQWDFDARTGITPHIDYMLYSMYDWATGLTAHAISDFDNCLGPSRVHGYLNDGLPPEKLVMTLSSYSRQWNGVAGYNGVGTSSSSSGFTDARFDVTHNTTFGGPYAPSYALGDEAGWYTWNDGVAHTRTFESLAAAEYEIRHALALQDPSGAWNGRRIRGVGFWSLFWMAELTSVDPRTGATVSRTRTYPHLYRLCAEVLAPPGTTRFPLEGFEGLDFRWRDPNESPDTVGDLDGDCARTLVAAPPGAPFATNNALRLDFDFETPGANAAFLAHEVLASPIVPGAADLNATLGHFDRSTLLRARVHSDGNPPGTRVRLVVVDADGELEASRAFAVEEPGWGELRFDLTRAAAVSGVPTAEPAFAPGDGVLDGAGPEAFGFVGFRLEATGAVSGAVTFDELTYEHANPGGRDYVINELRYAGAAGEYVEVYGPAGPLPAGLELRVHDGANVIPIPLTGVVPNDAGGFGFFVLGDPDVPRVDQTATFSVAGDDLPDLDPGAVQLVDPSRDCEYDGLVYEAFGGLGDLARRERGGVTSHGPPWFGEVSGGTDAKGRAYAAGRYPDGANRRVNALDFSFQPSSPGRANGGTLAAPARLDFSAPPAKAFQTFQSFAVSDPVAAGLPPSSDGGAAYRCVDTNGGGVIGVIGDAALGSVAPYRVRGELFVPSGAAAAQAVAVGFCGRSGSRFFSASAEDRSAYESGYWLIYENQPGVGLADGRPDHPGVFELVHATHDNQDAEPVALLGALSLGAAGAPEGAWTSFELGLEDGELWALVNGVEVWRGPIPEHGPTNGAIQVGFRENHAGGPGNAEGTWVDGLEIELLGNRRADGELLPVR